MPEAEDHGHRNFACNDLWSRNIFNATLCYKTWIHFPCNANRCLAGTFAKAATSRFLAKNRSAEAFIGLRGQLLENGAFSMICGFFSSSHLLTINKFQIRLSLDYCSHVWGSAPKSTFCLLDKVQSKAIHLINNPNLTKSLQPLSHRRLVGDLSIFYRYFNGYCSQETKDIIPAPLRLVRTTRSSTHSHPFQVSLSNPRTLSRKSSFIPTTCILWNVLPSSCFPESNNLPS